MKRIKKILRNIVYNIASEIADIAEAISGTALLAVLLIYFKHASQ